MVVRRVWSAGAVLAMVVALVALSSCVMPPPAVTCPADAPSTTSSIPFFPANGVGPHIYAVPGPQSCQVTFTLINSAYIAIGPPIEGFDSTTTTTRTPQPTVHIDSVEASWTNDPPSFSPLTLADQEQAATPVVVLPPINGNMLTVRYTIVDTGEQRAVSWMPGVGPAVTG